MTGQVSGEFEVRGDSDWYRVRFEAGKTYNINSGHGGATISLMLTDGTVYRPPVAYANSITFVAPKTGDYWLSVSDGYTGQRFYDINAVEVMRDPHPASVKTDLKLSVGGTVHMDTDTLAGEDDWYAVSLKAGQSYFVSAELGNRLYMADAQGHVVSDVATTQLHFTAAYTGRYYLGTHTWQSYSLSLKAVDDDYGTSVDAAGTLTVGQVATGVWETGGDSDWFAVELKAGTHYRFGATVPGEAYVSGAAQISDGAGNVLGRSSSGFPSLDFTPQADGVYYLAVEKSAEYYHPEGGWHYQLSASIVPNGPVPIVHAITVGETVDADWQASGEQDRYAITLTDGQYYSFVVRAADGSSGPFLGMRDSDGNYVTASAYNSSITTLNVGTGMTGTYYLIVRGAQAASYTLTSSSSGADDYLANSLTTGKMTVGGTASGTAEAPGDKDWFAIELVAHKSYGLLNGSAARVGIAIRDAQGHALNDVTNGDPYVWVATSGTYYVDVTGWEATDYEIRVVELEDDLAEDRTSTGVLRTEIAGSALADRLTGTVDHETIQGLAGDDFIEGGAGDDMLDGGAGVDTLSYAGAASRVIVSLANGRAQDTAGAGIDTIWHFENLDGSGFNDRLTGDDRANIINGRAGADVMIGLGGDDVYYADNLGDRVAEKSGQGYDMVRASIDYVLDANVEALVLTGAGDINGTGNGLANAITGNAGANRLDGGAGADRMVGRGGNDIYIVDNVGDKVIEQAGEGYDIVHSSVSFRLRGISVEELHLTGTGNLTGQGNADANVITGNSGNNLLRGDDGNDVLTGGDGRDQFLFDTALGPNNVDRITDFVVVDDNIRLDRSIFADAGPNGGLKAGMFQHGAVALEADDRILYDDATGNIYYDADGSGAGSAILFAQVMPGLAITHADFLIVG